MANLWHKTQALTDCFKALYRMATRHGITTLSVRLGKLEAEIRGENSPFRCPQCGATELEPTAIAPSPHSNKVSSFRCKACGQAFMPD